VLDFVVVIFCWIGCAPGFESLTALPALTILRPMRHVNSVKLLKILVASLPGPRIVPLSMVLLLLAISVMGLTSILGNSLSVDPDIERACELDVHHMFEETELTF
jgi:hypothetical protein